MKLLFDMDGVLVDSEPVINAAAIRGLAEYGVIAQPEDFLPFVGTGEDRYIGGVAEQYGVAYRVKMKHRVYAIYLEIVEANIAIFPGVHSLLAFLGAAGIPCALASSADRIKIEANLRAAGIATDLFGAIISGEHVEHKKPAPDIYLAAAAAIGALPAECLVVEDALNGIQAAKAAGMRCIAVTTTFSREELAQEGPDYICPDMPAVQALIASLLPAQA
jgi:HAD superfamily hydrolase (TIGR01509 family)